MSRTAMNERDVESLLMGLENVQQEQNFGYTFFFIGNDHRVPFATIGHSDNEFDKVSDLNRDGVFRINIGVSRTTYEDLFSVPPSEPIDYGQLNVFLPHPHYAAQHFICILNPAGENAETTTALLTEAHSIAVARFARKGTVPE